MLSSYNNCVSPSPNSGKYQSFKCYESINKLWNVNLSKEHFIRKSLIKVTSEKAALKYNLSSVKLKLK